MENNENKAKKTKDHNSCTYSGHDVLQLPLA